MIEEKSERARTLTTRRDMIVSHVKAIAGITAGVIATNLTNVSSARANGWLGWRNDHDGHHDGHHGGHHDGHHGGVPCFLRGTRIRTVDGEHCIEDLAIGDLLPTALAGTRPIQWIGSWRQKRKSGGVWQRFARPVRIARSALAPNVPYTDLYVSQRHAVFIDGALMAAGSLVNGKTIVLDHAEQFDQLEYFHIKLASHGVIFANGASCETLLSLPESARGVGEGAEREGDVEDRRCAPILCDGPRSQILSRARSVFSPMLGPQKIDLIRDRLEENAMALG